MKQVMIIFVSLFLLTGCTAGSDLETLGSIPQQPNTEPSQAQVLLQLPESAAADVLGAEGETAFQCDGYTISMQTVEAEDFQSTVRSLTGFDPAQLSIMESASGKADRYDFVWTCAAESGDMIGRGAIIDDGSFHYCLTVMAQAEQVSDMSEEWNHLFGSFYLETA